MAIIIVNLHSKQSSTCPLDENETLVLSYGLMQTFFCQRELPELTKWDISSEIPSTTISLTHPLQLDTMKRLKK